MNDQQFINIPATGTLANQSFVTNTLHFIISRVEINWESRTTVLKHTCACFHQLFMVICCMQHVTNSNFTKLLRWIIKISSLTVVFSHFNLCYKHHGIVQYHTIPAWPTQVWHWANLRQPCDHSHVRVQASIAPKLNESKVDLPIGCVHLSFNDPLPIPHTPTAPPWYHIPLPMREREKNFIRRH
jgi:hypothetical protein